MVTRRYQGGTQNETKGQREWTKGNQKVPRSNQKVPKGKPPDTKAEIRRYQKRNLKLSKG